MKWQPDDGSAPSRLSLQDMEALLSVTRALAAPFDLHTMLEAVAAAACRLLRAERASVWLHDADRNELYVEVASDLQALRMPVGVGLVGLCAHERRPINVPDCYAEPRFNPAVDRDSGFRSRCILTLPLIDHQGALVGVMQVLNKLDGVFDADDEPLALALSAQCAVALSRVRMTQALIAAELMRQEVQLASAMQRSTLPARMPQVEGYAMHGEFLPASLTGGDTYDLALIDQGLLVVLADATGHGVAPALSVTQMHAMLRMAFRLGASLETAFRQVNDQLAQTLPDSRFVTACIALLDARAHRLRFLSGGQAPMLHYRAEAGRCTRYRATSFPMGAMPLGSLAPPVEIELAPGDWFVLLSDGAFEAADAAGVPFGEARVEALVHAMHTADPAELAARLVAELRLHTAGQSQEDDITTVLLKRQLP
jgi:phosphoserine phosphatase RsbU/P